LTFRTSSKRPSSSGLDEIRVEAGERALLDRVRRRPKLPVGGGRPRETGLDPEHLIDVAAGELPTDPSTSPASRRLRATSSASTNPAAHDGTKIRISHDCPSVRW
jgi:hypothetical protein